MCVKQNFIDLKSCTLSPQPVKLPCHDPSERLTPSNKPEAFSSRILGVREFFLLTDEFDLFIVLERYECVNVSERKNQESISIAHDFFFCRHRAVVRARSLFRAHRSKSVEFRHNLKMSIIYVDRPSVSPSPTRRSRPGPRAGDAGDPIILVDSEGHCSDSDSDLLTNLPKFSSNHWLRMMMIFRAWSVISGC
jgi:hypothetical protein